MGAKVIFACEIGELAFSTVTFPQIRPGFPVILDGFLYTLIPVVVHLSKAQGIFRKGRGSGSYLTWNFIEFNCYSRSEQGEGVKS